MSICLIASTYPMMKFFPWGEYKNLVHVDTETLKKNMDLLIWLKENIDENEALMADIPTSSFIRSGSNFKLILHPQYEDKNLRMRVQDYYMFSACPPFSDAKEYFYKKYKSRYYINNIYRCVENKNSINTLSLADNIDSNYARCSRKKTTRFCSRVLYDTKNYKTLFRNGKYSVIYFLPTTIPDNTPYKFFNADEFSNLKYYLPWINECKKTDKKCPIHIEEVGRSYLDVLKFHKISYTLYSYVEKNYIDTNNIEMFYHLAEFYDYDMQNKNKAKLFYKKCVDLIIKKKDSGETDGRNGTDGNDVFDIENADSDNYYILYTSPFVSLARRMYMISSYAYFLTETKLYKTKNEVFILFFYLKLLVEAALYAFDHGFYYEYVDDKLFMEIEKGVNKDFMEMEKGVNNDFMEIEKRANKDLSVTSDNNIDAEKKLIKKNIHKFDTILMINTLCDVTVYLRKMKKNYNTKYSLFYQTFWTLIKRISRIHPCTLENFHLFENRNLTLWDYFRFFYFNP